MPGTIEQAGDVERLDRGIDLLQQLFARAALWRRQRDRAACVQCGSEERMRVEQEAGCQSGMVQAPRRLAEAGRGEVEQRQSLEQRRVAHRVVQSGDEHLGRVELGERDALVFAQRVF